ncbi:ABC transporter ATP-binding protein [Candidatus Bathyarchaeota archaeon]|nr:ABC transporter ATP-binding protein [Candidatus Bathyarchaeota archaeon]
MNLIEVNGLVKRYGKIEALHKVTFEVTDGITGLIGPNGAGKSTLIKILIGLISADSGEAIVFGLNPWKDRNRILKKVGVLHEKPRFPPWVTGREYLEYSAKLKGVSDIAREIERVSEVCMLAGFIDRKIGTFSAGMVQRLGLADALIGTPELVILDEPTANLDPLGRLDVLNRIRQLRDEEDMNFLISTHILSELERVCDHVVILNEGRVLTFGTVSELSHKCASPRYMIKVDNVKELLKGLSRKNTLIKEVRDDYVIIAVEDPDLFIKEINDLVANRTIVLEEMKAFSPTLEDVFVEVMKRRNLEEERVYS